MKQAATAVLLIFCLSICVHAEPRTLAIYLKQAGGLNGESREMMQFELQRLLDPAGIRVIWKDFGARKTGEDFDLVVVGSIAGSCSPGENEPAPTISAVQPLVSLADTAVSNNHILPFFEVDCSWLRRILGSNAGRPLMGRALARVIGHELYHILARTMEHRDAGIAKAIFSAEELSMARFDFDLISLARIRSLSIAGVT